MAVLTDQIVPELKKEIHEPIVLETAEAILLEETAVLPNELIREDLLLLLGLIHVRPRNALASLRVVVIRAEAKLEHRHHVLRNVAVIIEAIVAALVAVLLHLEAVALTDLLAAVAEEALVVEVTKIC